MADAKPFWRGVAFWIASILVALVAGAALYWWFGDRHALTWYPMQTEISALGVDERLSLLYEGRKLPRVTVGAVELRNAGNRAVWWGAQVDPQGGINLLPPRGAELLRCAVVAQSSANIGARCTRSTVNGASIEFRLIRPGEHVRLEYAHTGGMKAFPELKAETVDCQLTMPSWPLRWLQGALAVMVLASVVTWYRTLRYSVTGAHRPGG